MTFGFDNAVSEITLVVFTTLAPAGAIACAIICLLLLAPALEQQCRERIGQHLWIPVLTALVGLVASATHLGNPSNALYVLTGVGRSPLSNEIFIAVVAFGLAGGYWLYSFSRTRRPVLERIWLAAAACAALGFAAAMALAYDVDTIASWSLPVVPVNFVLSALVAGPLIALVAFVAAERSFAVPEQGTTPAGPDADSAPTVADPASGPANANAQEPAMYNLQVGRALVIIATVALVANAAGYVLQGSHVMGLANSAVSVAALVPCYYPCVAVFALLGAAAVCLDGCAIFCRRKLTVSRTVLAAALALAGVFAMRFVFYMMHLTVGISL